MTSIDWATLASFIGIALLVFLLGIGLLQVQRDRIRERLFGAAAGNTGGRGGGGEAVLTPGMLEAILEPPPRETRLDQEVRRAGWYKPNARRDFSSFRNSALIFVMIVTGVIAVAAGPEHPRLVARTIALGLMVLAVVWSVPRLYLRSVGNRRVKRIQRALPDALDLLTMCLTGGLSLSDAFSHVTREVFYAHPDLALELLIVKRQSELRSSEFAFQQFSRRIDAPEIMALSSLITQGQRLGTDVANSIREYADNMRLRRRQYADERSNKAGVKMLFPLTLCLLPSTFIILWGPSLLELFAFLRSLQGRDPTGL